MCVEFIKVIVESNQTESGKKSLIDKAKDYIRKIASAIDVEGETETEVVTETPSQEVQGKFARLYTEDGSRPSSPKKSNEKESKIDMEFRDYESLGGKGLWSNFEAKMKCEKVPECQWRYKFWVANSSRFPILAAVSNFVAFLPSEPSYTIVRDENGTKYKIHLSERAEWQHSSREQDQIDVFYARTRSGENTKYTLLFSHGNAVDLGQMSSFFIGLGTRLKVNILSYDQSSGKPNESNLNKACGAAYEKLLEKYNVRPDQVILYGQSIGTVPTTDLATKVDCAAVVLHSPLSSGFRVLFPRQREHGFLTLSKMSRKCNA
ncbi:Oidioi.mRNA.OKI2018_I69.PAR.g13080.t1.cds [Oikopleura dioica]|uniref:Oidioi.mRNA.OKI2018_I69.PAR.g13080.t1.cds n=1 Tax=Oikopleura dioica TaxID=34765 RepID=A0ABN7S695_OIKDI|nr:Oidioi.mRNA.OKI2018_I69.PAR.g13080.t1.cds [Oikopleura dioica]